MQSRLNVHANFTTLKMNVWTGLQTPSSAGCDTKQNQKNVRNHLLLHHHRHRHCHGALFHLAKFLRKNPQLLFHFHQRHHPNSDQFRHQFRRNFRHYYFAIFTKTGRGFIPAFQSQKNLNHGFRCFINRTLRHAAINRIRSGIFKS